MNVGAKILSISLFLLLINLQLSAQELFKIEDESISKEEFLYVFNKNNINKEEKTRKEAIDEYLDLYVNFKLKVREAMAEGLDKKSAFKKEFETYRNQLTETYLSDKEVSEELIKEAYDRSKEERKVSHILIKLAPTAGPEDTLKAHKRIAALREQVIKGADFAETAFRFSQDPSAKENKGMLGYISTFQTVYPFESGMYNTAVNEISNPVRSRFGYHIIKVHDIRNSLGELSAAHILIKTPKEAPDEVQSKNKFLVDSIYQLIQKKAITFEEAARRFSMDRTTATKGGQLPPFGSGRMVEEFETAAFALAKDGDVSAPIQTDFGWHIIKRLSKKDIGTLEEENNNLRKLIEKDARSKVPQQRFVERVKRENNFKENAASKNELIEQLDAKILRPGWKIEQYKRFQKPLFTIGKISRTQQDFIKFLQRNRNTKKVRDVKYRILKLYNAYVAEECTNLERSLLEEKYPEYNYLLNEYREGILLFELTEKKIWNKAMTDQKGLESFYERNKEAYRWEERADAIIYKLKDKKSANKVYKLAKKGKLSTKIASKFPGIDITSGAYEKNQNKYIDAAGWTAGTYAPSEWEDQYVVVQIKSLLEPTGKTLAEAKGFVISDYQGELEAEWIEALNKKYKVEINNETLKSLY